MLSNYVRGLARRGGILDWLRGRLRGRCFWSLVVVRGSMGRRTGRVFRHVPYAFTIQAGSITRSETVQVAVAAGRNQVLLAAAFARMHGIPRRVRATQPIVMAKHDRTRAVARVVHAGAILAGRERTTVRLRTGEDVVLVRHVADAIHVSG